MYCRFCGSTWQTWVIWWVLRWLLLYIIRRRQMWKAHFWPLQREADFHPEIIIARLPNRTPHKLKGWPGSEIALSWSPMRVKILHWRPEFHSWSPTFSHLATEKKGQSPVGAYLKKLFPTLLTLLLVAFNRRSFQNSSASCQIIFEKCSFWSDQHPRHGARPRSNCQAVCSMLIGWC